MQSSCLPRAGATTLSFSLTNLPGRFWKQGSQISFVVPAASYTRRDKEGRIVTVTRKPFTRRTLKADVWKYHLREMAAHDEPLRYIRRFLVIEGDVQQSKSVAS